VRRARWTPLVAFVLGAVSLLAPPLSAAARGTDASVTAAATTWRDDLDRLIGDRPFSVTLGRDGEVWYDHKGWVRRPPASNEKLLLSMVLLDRLGPGRTIVTEARADGQIADGVLHGDLWLVGHGDPEIAPQDLRALAEQVRALGIRRIVGGVAAATGPFSRDWWAPGWKDYFPAIYIPRPTGLTFDGNESPSGVNIDDPELRAAKAMTGRLRALDIVVRDPATMGAKPGGTTRIAATRSEPLAGILRRMNVKSSNFRAEVLGKWLAASTGRPATIAAGAATVCGWIERRDQDFTCHDGSGLSYDNRSSSAGIVSLLWFADDQDWARTLRESLAKPGIGTLGHPNRMMGLTVRAKTGTLTDVSALSGWVRSELDDRWIAFSVLSSHFDDATAKGIEDEIVELIAAEATDPTP
jgi:D-alanyl-D-alanine carboxypeptidase/D-alanyl-D-alanine-endopeptidase (penicillin-binding protein 4)